MDEDNLNEIKICSDVSFNSPVGLEITKQIILCKIFEESVRSLESKHKNELYSEFMISEDKSEYTNVSLATKLFKSKVDLPNKKLLKTLSDEMIPLRQYSPEFLITDETGNIPGYLFLGTRTKNIDYNEDYLTGSESFPKISRISILSQIRGLMTSVGYEEPHYIVFVEDGWVLSGIYLKLDNYQDKVGRTISGTVSIGHKCDSSDAIKIFKQDFLYDLLKISLSKFWEETDKDALNTITEWPVYFDETDLIQLPCDKLKIKRNVIRTKPSFGINCAYHLFTSGGFYCSNIKSRKTIKDLFYYRTDRTYIYNRM